jgi:hypothetical protein
LTRMAAPPAPVGRVVARFGISSVGEGGSVGRGQSRPRSSACARRTCLSAALKIRVSMVRWTRAILTRGLSGPILAGNGPTIGLSEIGSIVGAGRDGGETSGPRP